MACCQCKGIEKLFDKKNALKELKRYKKKGPIASTRLLVEGLLQQDLAGKELLDIGGGIGAIQYELFQQGLVGAVDVDGSAGYLAVAEEEAARQGLHDKIKHLHGNFLDLAGQVEAKDIVTLDRVICCFPDMPGMVKASLPKAKKYYGIVFPKDVFLAHLLNPLANFFFWLLRNPFRVFIHPTRQVEQLIQQAGFQRIYYKTTLVWQIFVFERVDLDEVK